MVLTDTCDDSLVSSCMEYLRLDRETLYTVRYLTHRQDTFLVKLISTILVSVRSIAVRI